MSCGQRWIQVDAFPLQRDIASFCYRWWVDSTAEIPKCWLKRRPRLEIVSAATEIDAYGLAGSTMESKLSLLGKQEGVAQISTAPRMVDCCHVEMTVTLKRLGNPFSSRGGRLPGTREGTSLRGAKAADWAAEKTACPMELCLRILSRFPPQPAWWSPKGLATAWQRGYLRPSKISGDPTSTSGYRSGNPYMCLGALVSFYQFLPVVRGNKSCRSSDTIMPPLCKLLDLCIFCSLSGVAIDTHEWELAHEPVHKLCQSLWLQWHLAFSLLFNLHHQKCPLIIWPLP